MRFGVSHNSRDDIFQTDECPIVHRVVAMRSGCFLTKGDHNRGLDLDCVSRERVMGVVRMRIPWIGRLKNLFTLLASGS